MSRKLKMFLAAGIAVAAVAGGAGAAYAMLQAPSADALRASGEAGEDATGYLAAVGSGSGDLRRQIDAVNIQRRAKYTELAASRGVKIEEVAAATACQIIRGLKAGQYYRLPGGQWQQRGSAPPQLPSYCT
jgi:uncharacterized protein YdbL (DUF1318 family)